MKPLDRRADLLPSPGDAADQPKNLQARLEAALSAARSPANRHTYLLAPDEALTAAIEQARAGRAPAGPLSGRPVSVKDLLDVAGQTTAAGSKVRMHAPPAQRDSPAVARVRAAGACIAGRTNMTEFAFSGVGINPYHGTPANPAFGRSDAEARIPGGSSSGAAVSVATGAAWAGLGSDTGGSLRIPAALCGLVGFKSTARLVPTDGALPLSPTLDTVGAITRNVSDAVLVHEILAGRQVAAPGRPLAQRRLGVARGLMLEGLEPEVAQAFESSLQRLSNAGARIEELELPFEELPALNAGGGFSAAESHRWHRTLLEEQGEHYDQRVALRIRRGALISDADLQQLHAARRGWMARMNTALEGFDAMLSPTVPMTAPLLAPLLASDEAFFATNALLLRNPSAVNMLDGCALSLPCHEPGQAPVGLMIWHGALRDDAVLDVALQAEAALAQD